MKKFLIKSLIGFTLLAMVIGAFKSSVPYYWGNGIIQPKIEYLSKHHNKFDTYFVGSSKIYRHLVPAVYDSITGKKSFNFGAGGTFHLEMNFLFENFIKDHPLAPETEIIFQKIEPNEISTVNFNSVKTKYCMDGKRALIGVKYFAKRKNWDEVYFHVSTYLQNLFAIGLLFPIVDYHISDSPKYLKLTKKQKGFLAYDQELRVTKDRKKRLAIRKGRERYLLAKANGTLPKGNRDELTIRKLNAREVDLVQFPEYKYFIFKGSIAGKDSANVWNYGHYSLKGAIEHTVELAQARMAIPEN